MPEYAVQVMIRYNKCPVAPLCQRAAIVLFSFWPVQYMPQSPFIDLSSTANARQALRQASGRLWGQDAFADSLRVLLALSAAMLWSVTQDQPDGLIPLFLGIIASALAETDDNWRGRLLALGVTLLCFAAASLSVELLFPYPLPFALVLGIASFGLVMLGALGGRYASIGSATLILSIYTMITVDQRDAVAQVVWQEPARLLAGAAGYGLLSVLWQALFTQQAVQQALARVFIELGEYLKLKSRLFEPLTQLDVEGHRLALAHQNGRVVAALNDARDIIVHRLARRRAGRRVNRYLKLYFLAQDIHERASSSHYPYHRLAEAFFHSDVMFRFQRVLRQQGSTCKALGRALRQRHPFDYGNAPNPALDDLRTSLAWLREQPRPEWRVHLRLLGALMHNLLTMENALTRAGNPERLEVMEDSALQDRTPRSLREGFARLRSHLTPASSVFRHAVRLGLLAPLAYGLVQWMHSDHSYWILLTTVFVCQPSYGATRRRLIQRVVGTLLGLGLAWAFLGLFLSPVLQSLFAVLAGVVFFATRHRRYMIATAAITVLVLFCFNRVGDGYAALWPRLVDTLIGCALAGAAVLLIMPDWQGRRLHRLQAAVLSSNGRYLRQIMQQYDTGKRDDLAYRVARREAHNADAALAATLANMQEEPGQFRGNAEAGLRFLALSHGLLNYLSALGAHRALLEEDASDALIDEAAARLADWLEQLADRLLREQPFPARDDTAEQLALSLENVAEGLDEGHRLVQSQLGLICRQVMALRDCLDETAAHVGKDEAGGRPVTG